MYPLWVPPAPQHAASLSSSFLLVHPFHFVTATFYSDQSPYSIVHLYKTNQKHSKWSYKTDLRLAWAIKWAFVSELKISQDWWLTSTNQVFRRPEASLDYRVRPCLNTPTHPPHPHTHKKERKYGPRVMAQWIKALAVRAWKPTQKASCGGTLVIPAVLRWDRRLKQENLLEAHGPASLEYTVQQ